MPRVGTRAQLISDLVKSSLHLLSVINLTYQSPSYLPLQVFLHFELMKTGTLLLLENSQQAVTISMITLVGALETYLNGCLKLEEAESNQHALREHCFRIGVILGEALEQTERIRYFEDRLYENRKDLQEIRFSAVFNGSDRNFMKYARMSKENFFRLVPLISDDLVFHNSSSRPQLPVEWQLLVTLCQLGFSGNGGSSYMIGQMFGVSEGSVHNFTARCFEALLKLESQYVYWPDEQERTVIKSEIGARSFFKDCVGFIDGTLIPLAVAPLKNPEDFWTRKFMYALNSMLVCDHNARIIYALHGWCGSSHDQRVFASTQLAQHPERFFSEGEYILADSGYTCTQNIIPTFKSPRSYGLDHLKKEFNTALSEQRVVSEHGNGMLKLRFQSLRDMRLIIKDARSATHCVNWLRVACLLHNFTLKNRDAWKPKQPVELVDEQGPQELPINHDPNASYARRNELLQDFRRWQARRNV